MGHLEFSPHQGLYDVDIFNCKPFRMFSWNDSHRAHNILIQKAFEPMSMDVWIGLMAEATCVIDIGAQEGMYSLVAASLMKENGKATEIHAFEPNPDAYARLDLHARINDFPIRCHREAVAHQHGTQVLTWQNKGWLISSGARLGYASAPQNTSVMCILAPLDSFKLNLGLQPIIKIDVEGAELYVLQGMKKTLDAKPDILLETFDPMAAKAWTEECKKRGYTFVKIYEKEHRVEDVPEIKPCDHTSGDFNHLLVAPQ